MVEPEEKACWDDDCWLEERCVHTPCRKRDESDAAIDAAAQVGIDGELSGEAAAKADQEHDNSESRW